MRTKDIHKEKAIIEKTLEIVSETGIAGIKMSVLAKRVGISPSTLYVYFSTKEDLIISVGEMILKEFAKGHKEAIDESKPFKTRFKAKWIRMLNFQVNNQREVNFIEQWKQSPFFNKRAEEIWSDNKQKKNNLFEEGKELGIFKPLDEHTKFALIFGFSSQLVNLSNQGSIKLNKEVIENTFEVVWDALRS